MAQPSKKLSLGFLSIPSALSYHTFSKTQPPTQQQQQEKRGNKFRRMNYKKLPLILFFLLSVITILRLLRITANTSSSPPPLLLRLSHPQACPTPSPTCTKKPSPQQQSENLKHHQNSSPLATNFTTKELLLLHNVISFRAPCNLLIFGLNPQFFPLAALNAGGTTIFLEDDAEKISTANKSRSRHIYKVEHKIEAGRAYELLRHARMDPACRARGGLFQASGCQLALTSLPKVVYERKWDVVMIDGPTGDRMQAPGRMGVIYSVGVMARAGNMTDVLVHDMDRMIEKWYSWEFLCDENLVSSKGKLWHFRITGNSNSTSFCSNSIHIE